MQADGPDLRDRTFSWGVGIRASASMVLNHFTGPR